MADEFSRLVQEALDKPAEAGNRMHDLAAHLAGLLGLPRQQVRAHEVSKPGNLKVRFIPRRGDNAGLAVITGGDRDRTAKEAADLVRDGSFRTIALTIKSRADWTISDVVSSDAALASKFSARWPGAIVRQLGQTIAGKSRGVGGPTAIDTGCFEGFDPDAFTFLRELAQNNETDEWFKANEDRAKDLVAQPVRCLVQALGPFLTALGPLETDPARVMSRFRHEWKAKEGVYRLYFWAAFYRASVARKQADVQLDLSIGPIGFQHGLYFGEDPEVRVMRTRLRVLLDQRGDEVLELLRKADLPERFRFLGGPVDPKHPDFHQHEITDAGRLRAWAQESFPRLSHFHAPDDPLLRDPEGLVAHLAEDYARLWPLFVLITSEDDPIAAAQDAMERDVQEVEAVEQDSDIDWDAVMAKTCLDEKILRQMERALRQKRQIVLNGPPGTGKTWVALIFGEYFAKSPDRVKLIQFHPSYAYEDFVEGIRAKTVKVSGGRRELDYGVEDGIFKLLCDEARKPANAGKDYVLIIDELNRGNVARIFGELLFLLEYRDKRANLPYSRLPFQIPRNVFLIGTMNTADRSIALVDFALRRRFSFIEIAPSLDVLTCWLDTNAIAQKTAILALWERVNRDIEKADYRIGHSHFLRDHTPESLRDLWELDLQPYLAEYFFTTPDRVKVIGKDVEAILKGIEAAAS